MKAVLSFSRPIRWFVALLGESVIQFEYAGVASSNVTRGLRPYDSPEIKIASADKYFDVIREAGIVLDKEERKASIVEQVKQAAALVGGEAIFDYVGATGQSPLLDEVTNLVEMPTAVMGEFNSEFLQLPREVLISVMKKHQRYFPIPSISIFGENGGKRWASTAIISLPFATATTLALTLSVRATSMCSVRALQMQTSLSAKI